MERQKPKREVTVPIPAPNKRVLKIPRGSGQSATQPCVNNPDSFCLKGGQENLKGSGQSAI